jgi:hypothetical protein
MGFQALLLPERPSVTAKSPGSVISMLLVPELSLLRTMEFTPGISLFRELLGSRPLRPSMLPSWANTGAATAATRSTVFDFRHLSFSGLVSD